MPTITEFPDRPYLGIKREITMTTFGLVGDRIAEMIGWLLQRGVTLAGAPFFRYEVIDMPNDRLLVHAGIPVASPVEPEGDYFADVLPAGRYATVLHHGHPDQLMGVTADLLRWATDQGLKWDMTEEADGEHWVARTEHYLTDPRERPDLHDWDTELQFRLA
ncbi:GyrI-like domain-containing protein [Nonomuraea sediminis]|uniref:GyrI-like domain-containing protein n=1 Tax=Nonomuraea sediminis TaxID=2835864 RepID=UPI001BDC6F51|nr:GyrI-like domain-containing protein [Nonomuraea sediminis]